MVTPPPPTASLKNEMRGRGRGLREGGGLRLTDEDDEEPVARERGGRFVQPPGAGALVEQVRQRLLVLSRFGLELGDHYLVLLHASSLPGAEEAVAGIAEPGEYVAAGVQLPIQRRRVHRDVGVSGQHLLYALPRPHHP